MKEESQSQYKFWPSAAPGAVRPAYLALALSAMSELGIVVGANLKNIIFGHEAEPIVNHCFWTSILATEPSVMTEPDILQYF